MAEYEHNSCNFTQRSSKPGTTVCFLQEALRKKGKSLAELDVEELKLLQHELETRHIDVTDISFYPAQFLFGNVTPDQSVRERVQSLQFPRVATLKVSKDKLQALDALEAEDSPRGEAARTVHFKEL